MQTVISRDGTRIAYERLGSGPPMIYVTGATCFRSFKPVAEHARGLAASFSVVNFDRRGRGDSSDLAPWTVAKEVDDIEALIDANGGKATVYGHSSGAVLAIEAGLRLGGKVERLVLYDPAYANGPDRSSYRDLCATVTGLLDANRHAQALKAFLAGIGMPRPFVWLLPLTSDWKTMVQLAPTLAYDMALTRDRAPVDRVASLPMPVLCIVGAKSPPSMHAVARELRSALPHARHESLPGQDHIVDAKALLPLMRTFCNID